MRVSFITNVEQCQQLWQCLVRPKYVSDRWEFRLCFHDFFRYQPCFLLMEDHRGISGMLPLSYADDLDMFVFFPGEIWAGKTWLERTPCFTRESHDLRDLLSACPDRTLLRYIELPRDFTSEEMSLDEFGYTLYPRHLGYDISRYGQRFSRKKFKSILKVIQSYDNMHCTFHFNRLQDFDVLVDMSLRQFGPQSYLNDSRFREGSGRMMHFLHQNKLLRLVSLEINGRIAAVDLGAVYRGIYTVFLGGTDPEFPSIAKLMNMHHIDFSCRERLSKIDFLCGDFHWKKLWHLDPEPLYKYESPLLIGAETAVRGHTPLSVASLHSS